jgi:hypothetical protein
MGPMGDLVFVSAVLGVLAAWVIWGWRSWMRRGSETSFLGWLSVSGFLLASLSASLQISSGIYAQFADGFSFNDPTLLRIYFIGFWLALLGLVSGLFGSFRNGPLRFKAPSLSAFLILLWIWHAMAE